MGYIWKGSIFIIKNDEYISNANQNETKKTIPFKIAQI